jgi:hypothetical protein
MGRSNYDKETKILDAFEKKYEKVGLFPYPNGYELFLEGKISHLILFFDNMTKGIQWKREPTHIKVNNLDNFEVSFLYFNSSSEEKINSNLDHFQELNEKLNLESGAGGQL